ncbi:hypothetical protein ACJIZ3_013718 [Penstemon smallii]|uniref:Uncharacterized protein n=1 Tax=Penstemon smallii TaxID=265156 RepID=A0ABD3RHF4_9LAMI
MIMVEWPMFTADSNWLSPNHKYTCLEIRQRNYATWDKYVQLICMYFKGWT